MSNSFAKMTFVSALLTKKFNTTDKVQPNFFYALPGTQNYDEDKRLHVLQFLLDC